MTAGSYRDTIDSKQFSALKQVVCEAHSFFLRSSSSSACVRKRKTFKSEKSGTYMLKCHTCAQFPPFSRVLSSILPKGTSRDERRLISRTAADNRAYVTQH